MSEPGKKLLNFGTLGIVIGIIAVVISLVWVAVITFFHDEDKSGDSVTWVG